MQSKKWSKNNLIALLVAIGLHLLLVLVVLLVVLPTTHLHDKGGILVNIGDVAFAQGEPAPEPFRPQPDEARPTPSKEPTEEPLLTQDNPEAPAVKAPDKKQPTAEELERQRRLKAEEEARRKREEINRRVAGAFGDAERKSNSQGNSSENNSQGKQGSPDGNVPTGGADSGVGGFGSFDLGGRSLAGGGLSRPSYNAQVEGTIRIKIIVDPQGRVIHTSIAPGTTIDNYQMQRSALQAAERTRFNAIEGKNNQEGYITYRYQLR